MKILELICPLNVGFGVGKPGYIRIDLCIFSLTNIISVSRKRSPGSVSIGRNHVINALTIVVALMTSCIMNEKSPV